MNKKASGGLGYGGWLSPEGIITPVENQQHHFVATKLVEDKNLKMNPLKAEDALYQRGYAALKFVGGLAIRHRQGLTDDQKKVILQTYVRAFKDGVGHIENLFGERSTFSNSLELDNALEKSALTRSDKNFRILKQAQSNYGHWVSPNGQVVPVENQQDHFKVARKILVDLGNEVEENPSRLGSITDQLLELGWAATSYDNEITITTKTLLNEAQAQAVQKLAQIAPKSLWEIRIDVPGFENKNIVFGKDKLRYVKDILTGNMKRLPLNLNFAEAEKRGFVKSSSTTFEDFLKSPDATIVNPKNQVGNQSNLYDVQRYVMDSYSTKTAISKTKNKVTVSTLTTHGFLGSVAFNKYWTYDLDEWKKAIETYKVVNEIIEETVEEFIEEEITSTVFWPILKFKLDKIEPEKNAACNIPWVNYSRYYNKDENPDWRQNIYGNRYPKYDEPSYDQEVRRKGVFFD